LMMGLLSEINSVSLSPDYNYMAQIGDRCKLNIGDRRNLDRANPGGITEACAAAFRPVNSPGIVEIAIIGVGETAEINRFDVPHDIKLPALPIDNATCVHYSCNGEFVAAGNHNGLIRVWRLDGDDPYLVAHGDFGWPITSIAFHPDNHCIYATLGNGL